MGESERTFYHDRKTDHGQNCCQGDKHDQSQNQDYGYIEEKLAQLKPEKKSRIVNAAMKEFTKGYKYASTDAIVKEAGISKGLLFHYFGTKKQLFLYIVDTATNAIASEYISLIDFSQPDVLERINQMILLKIDLCAKYPSILAFLLEVYMGDRGDAGDFVQDRRIDIMTEAYEKLFQGIDLTLFREDVDTSAVLNIIMFAMRGYSEDEISRGRRGEPYKVDFDRYVQEIEGYTRVMRKCFYKKADGN